MPFTAPTNGTPAARLPSAAGARLRPSVLAARQCGNVGCGDLDALFVECPFTQVSFAGTRVEGHCGCEVVGLAQLIHETANDAIADGTEQNHLDAVILDLAAITGPAKRARLDLVCTRPDGLASVAIEIDQFGKVWSLRKLLAEIDAGCRALWVRLRGRTEVEVPACVGLVDIHETAAALGGLPCSGCCCSPAASVPAGSRPS